MLTKEAILAADDLPRERVNVPEWPEGGHDGEVCVRTMSGVERDHFEQAVSDARGTRNHVDFAGLKALLVVLTVCDDQGQPLFCVDDAGALNAKSAAAIERLYKIAARLNALLPEDAEELVGN